VANVSPAFSNDCWHHWELQISKPPLKTSQTCRNNHKQNSWTQKYIHITGEEPYRSSKVLLLKRIREPWRR